MLTHFWVGLLAVIGVDQLLILVSLGGDEGSKDDNVLFESYAEHT